jgi:hypothetical protein
MGWAFSLGDFFTNSSGHPDRSKEKNRLLNGDGGNKVFHVDICRREEEEVDRRKWEKG